MKIRAIVVAIGVLCAALASEAAAKHRHGKWHHRSGAAQSVEPGPTQTDRRDNATLCNGGPMVTVDDQIRGCNGLVSSRLSRERKATALYNRGNAYFGKNDLARAIADYSDALTYRSDYAQAYFNRAVAYRVSGQFQPAISDYTTALGLQPNDADALAGRGAAYARLPQPDKALADFNQALSIKPGHLEALVQRGHHFVRMHLWPAAIADYDAALAISPAAVEALYGRGVAKMYAGTVKEGQMDLTQALLLDAGVASRMTSQGIPPPQVVQNTQEQAPPIERRKTPPAEKPADTGAHDDSAQQAPTSP